MNRRQFLTESTSLIGAMATVSPIAQAENKSHRWEQAAAKPLRVPKTPIKVAFLISDDFAVIDFAGPWEIFQDVLHPGTHKPAFELYTVSQSRKAVRARGGGLRLVPEHSLESAALPNVLVVPAQSDDSEAVLSWIRKVAAHSDMTMSVCTGAFLLAKAGVLDGLEATTHHGAYKLLSVDYPRIQVHEKVRYVDNGRIATSGGLSAGIDLALHIVSRYFGEAVADTTAAEVEYAGHGWKDPHNTGDIFKQLQAAQKGRTCPVCGMGPIGTETALLYKGTTYFFCSENCRRTFLKRPQAFVPRD